MALGLLGWQDGLGVRLTGLDLDGTVVHMASTGEAVLVVDHRSEELVVIHETRPSRGHRLFALLGLAPVALVLLATRGHLGISYDSVMYSSTWRELQGAGGWDFPAIQPPGLQWLIAVTGGPLSSVLLVFNLAAVAATTVLTYLTGLRVTGSTPAAAAAALWFGLSLGTVQIHSMLWSEPLFCLAIAAALYGLVLVFDDGPSAWPLVLVLIAVNGASLMRYMGISLVAVTGCLLLAAGWRSARWKGLVLGGLTGVLGGTAQLAVMGWHYATGAPLTGPRSVSPFTALEVTMQTPDALVAFLVNREHVVPPIVAAAVCLVGVAVIAAAWRRFPEPGRAVPLVAWAGGYVVVLSLSAMTTNVNAFDFRLLLPVMPAVAVLVAGAVHVLAGRRALWPTVAFLAFTAAGTLLWTPHGATSHLDYAPPTRPAAGLAAAVEANVPADAAIVSNDPSHLIWLTGRDLVWRFPDAGAYPTSLPEYAVWFTDTAFPLNDEGVDFAQLVDQGPGFEIWRATTPG